MSNEPDGVELLGKFFFFIFESCAGTIFCNMILYPNLEVFKVTKEKIMVTTS